MLLVAPPVALYGSRVGEGHLGLKFLRVRVNPWEAASKCVQVSMSCDDPAALTLLRDRINEALMRCTVGSGGSGDARGAQAGGRPVAGAAAGTAVGNRRPLVPRSLNTLSMRSGAPTPASSCGGGAASTAAASLGSLGTGGTRQLASSGDSRPGEGSSAGWEEELPALSQEQEQVLELVKAGKSIFFTGVLAAGGACS